MYYVRELAENKIPGPINAVVPVSGNFVIDTTSQNSDNDLRSGDCRINNFGPVALSFRHMAR